MVLPDQYDMYNFSDYAFGLFNPFLKYRHLTQNQAPTLPVINNQKESNLTNENYGANSICIPKVNYSPLSNIKFCKPFCPLQKKYLFKPCWLQLSITANKTYIVNMLIRMIITAILLCSSLTCLANDVPLIAASSDLQNVLPKLVSLFTLQTGEAIHFKFASSKSLSIQINHGTPYQLFLADDKNSIVKVVRSGKALDNGKIYATGYLALYAPKGSILSPPLSFSKLALLSRQNRINRFAVPNTEQCAYGRAARQALMRLRLWVRLQPEIIPALSSYTTAHAALNADGGIIPYSLAIAPEFASKGYFILISQSLYDPIKQYMVLLKNAGKTATDFYTWMQTPQARTIIAHNGYDLP